MCVITKERYQTYQTGFSFCRQGHALGVGLGVLMGIKSNYFRRSVRYAIILQTHWTKFNQFWCVSYSHAWGVQRYFFKGSNIIKFQLQSKFQIFLYRTLCLLSQMNDTKHIRWDFHSVA